MSSEPVTETAPEDGATSPFRLALEQLPAGAALLRGPDHVFVAASDAYRRMVGARALDGRPLREALPELASQGFVARLDRVYATGRPETGTAIPAAWDDDGDGVPEPHFVDFTYHPACDGDGRVWGVIAHVTDVTERVRAADALRESEARFRIAADAAPVLIWMAGPDGGCDWFNRPWLEFTGRTLEQERGDGWAEGVHPDDLERCLETYRRALARREAFRMEYRLRRADGEHRWLLDTGVPRLGSAGELLGYVGSCVDVHERVEQARLLEEASTRLQETTAELEATVAALRQGEQQFRSLADSIPQLAWIADGAGWIYWYNRRWFDYTGSTLDQMQGWGWTAVHHPDHVERVRERFLRCIEEGRPWEDTFPLRAASGEYRWFLSRALPIRGADGRVARWFGTNTDVTEERRAAEERERLLAAERAAREEAEAANQAKAQFLSAMSHELRTPLNAIAGYADLLDAGVHGPLSPDQHRDLQRIQRASQHLLGLINDVLNFARLEAGRVEFRVEEVALSAALDEVAGLLEPQVAAHGLTLEREDAGPATVRADPEKLRQVLLNLLTNAVKYTPRGGRIALSTAPGAAPGSVEVRVADTGRGIAPAQLERIFEPFVQVDRHLALESQQGVGLGLAISRDLARGMGGELRARSREGHGSVFTLTLPRGG